MIFCIGVTRVEMDWRCSWKRGNHISNVTLTSNLIGSQGLLSLLLHHCSFISKAFDDCWKVLNVKYHQNFAINVQDAIAPECESGWSQWGWKTEILSKPDQPTNQGQHDLFWTRQKSLFSTTLTNASLVFMVLQTEQKDALHALTNDET